MSAAEQEPEFHIVRPMDISHAVDHWLGELERKNESERTVDTYRRFLHKLADEYPTLDIGDVTSTQLRAFLDHHSRRKRDGKRKAAATIAQQVTIVNGFFDWVTFEGFIARNPARRNGQRILSRPKQIAADENDNVTTISSNDVALLMHAADSDTTHTHYWARRLAVYTAALLGPRRAALASVRIGDYDPVERVIRFYEKGAKTISKPVPDDLAEVIGEAIKAGVYPSEDGSDYLIPGRAQQRRDGDRDDRVIWHLIRDVAEDVNVKTHVHALRAAFAVHYLETHDDQNALLALKDLLGHKRLETTLVYLRRLKRRQGMETVRDLSFGKPQNAVKPLEAKAVTEKEGFEPSSVANAVFMRPGTQHEPAAPGEGTDSLDSAYTGNAP